MLIAWTWMFIRTFFGWGNNDEPLQHTEQWFIQEILSTWDSNDWYNSWNDITWTITPWDIETWNNTETKINTPKDAEHDYTEVKVMMPRYFYTTWRKKFAEYLFDSQKIYMNFIFIDDLNSYRYQLTNPQFSEADLFLFPYDWHEIVKVWEFSSGNIVSEFDPLVSPIVDKNQIWFIPFAADPMVLYTTVSPIPTNFDSIWESVYNRDPTIQIAFPIFFGISSEDFENKWWQWEYQDIVRYALMHYFSNNKDKDWLQKRVDSNILNSDWIKNYNISNLNYIQKILNNSDCDNFPSICFQIRNFVGSRFGFFSDADIVQKYFSNKKSDFEKISKTTVPFQWIESPVRIRWRWVADKLDASNPKDLKNAEAIWILLMQYIKNHENYDFRGSTLSVFKSETWNWLIDNHYIWARWYILEKWWNYISDLQNNEDFQGLINYRITAWEYLSYDIPL